MTKVHIMENYWYWATKEIINNNKRQFIRREHPRLNETWTFLRVGLSTTEKVCIKHRKLQKWVMFQLISQIKTTFFKKNPTVLFYQKLSNTWLLVHVIGSGLHRFSPRHLFSIWKVGFFICESRYYSSKFHLNPGYPDRHKASWNTFKTTGRQRDSEDHNRVQTLASWTKRDCVSPLRVAHVRNL